MLSYVVGTDMAAGFMASRYCVQDMLAPETLRNRGLCDPKAVQKLMELDMSGYIDAAYPMFGVCPSSSFLLINNGAFTVFLMESPFKEYNDVSDPWRL